MTQNIPNATSALTDKANKRKSPQVARNDYFFGSIRLAAGSFRTFKSRLFWRYSLGLSGVLQVHLVGNLDVLKLPFIQPYFLTLRALVYGAGKVFSILGLLHGDAAGGAGSRAIIRSWFAVPLVPGYG